MRRMNVLRSSTISPLVLLALVLAGAPLAATVTLDTFDTSQAVLSLTFPPTGTSASSSVAGAGMLGGERDLEIDLTAGVIAGNEMSAVVSSGFYSYSQDATIAGTGRLEWDGADGSAALDPTGLGGVDLTEAGTQDALRLIVAFDDLPVDVTLEVFTDGGNASSVTFSLPGLIFVATDFVVPFSAFTPTLGAGADFTVVGAVVMTVGSAVTAPDVVIDVVETTALVGATKTVALTNDVNGNTLADPGDTLTYTLVISNPDDAFDAAATALTTSDTPDGNTALVVGSVTTTQGTVTAGNGGGDTAVAVDVGTLADGAAATITFQVTIDSPLAAGVTQVVNQGTVATDSLTGLLTDDPGVGGAADPTAVPVGASPIVVATKVDGLEVDGNGNGQANPGDTLRYTVVLTNTGNQDAGGVVFTDAPDANTTLVVGSVSTTQGTVTSGNGGGDTSVAVDVGTVPGGGGSVTLQFDVTVNNSLPAGTTAVSNQGAASGSNFAPVSTDDPATGPAGDATTTPIAIATATEIPTLNGWALLTLAVTLLGLSLRLIARRRATGR